MLKDITEANLREEIVEKLRGFEVEEWWSTVEPPKKALGDVFVDITNEGKFALKVFAKHEERPDAYWTGQYGYIECGVTYNVTNFAVEYLEDVADSPEWAAESAAHGIYNLITETVFNQLGQWIDYHAAVYTMDDDLRETLHTEMAPCTQQAFFDAYTKRHLEKFGEDFAPTVGEEW